MICTAAFMAQLIVMGIHNSFGILYTTLLEEYKKSKAETGMFDFFTDVKLTSKPQQSKFTSANFANYFDRGIAWLGDFLWYHKFASSQRLPYNLLINTVKFRFFQPLRETKFV